MKIDVTTWKEFKISDFFDVSLSAGDLKIEECECGDIPLVSSGQTNNGIVGYINRAGDGKAQIFTGNKITVDMFCNAFYQPNDFYAVSHGRVNILSPKFAMNNLIALFLATIINSERFKFSYGRAVYSNEIARMEIMLPATKDGQADWKYIENYMKSLKHKPISTKNRNHELPSLRKTDWIEFKLTDIFTHIEQGKAHDNLLDSGSEMVYIGAKKDDNGVMRHCAKNDTLSHQGNCIIFICNGQGSVGYTLYMNKPFIATTDVKVGYCENLNAYTGLFLVTVLDKERQKYSFGRKWGPHLKSTTIKLPAKDNQPDWEFMERYIKSMPYGDKIVSNFT